MRARLPAIANTVVCLFRSGAVLFLVWIGLLSGNCRSESLTAYILADSQGRVLTEKHADRPMVPASTLKVLTALSALEILGPDFRYATDIFFTDDAEIVIKGYGDPLLTSEVLSEYAGKIAGVLKAESRPEASRIVIDNTWFDKGIDIPGVGASLNPYDAAVGAVCANFSTVFFDYDPQKDQFISAEPQTPLLPFLLPRIRKTGLKTGRISLHPDEAPLYAGRLFRYFLQQEGIRTGEPVLLGTVQPGHRKLATLNSPLPLTEVVRKLMAYSNNVVANQLLLTLGASVYGPPATLEKGVQAIREIARKKLGLTGITLAEGSGISRENRISPRQMLQVLLAFADFYDLLIQNEDEYYKTGTLSGIRTRAGYLTDPGGRLFPFVIMTSGSDTAWKRILEGLRAHPGLAVD